jgi:hypothetical protein
MKRSRISPYKLLFITIALSASLMFSGCKRASDQTATQQASSAPESNPAATPSAGPSSTASTSTPAATPPQNVPAAPAAAPPPPPPPIVVPAGTRLSVRLGNELSSKASNAGAGFSGTLATSVSVHGETAIPAGSSIVGTVTDAKSAGKFKGAASLGLTLQSITIRGRSYPISTSVYSQQTTGKGKRTAGLIGGGAAGGALIGGLASGGKGAAIGAVAGAGAGTAGAALTGNDRDITLSPETVLSFKLMNSINVATES